MKSLINHEHLLNNLSNGIIVFDGQAQIVYANNKAIEWLALVPDPTNPNLILAPEWLIVDKFGEALVYEQYPAYLAAHSETPLENYEVGVFNHSDNKFYWFLCDGYTSASAGNEDVLHVVTFTNISGQKEHIPFKGIVENANDAVIVSDAVNLKGDGPSIVYVNKQFSKLTGFDASEAIGNTTSIVQGEKTSPVSKKRIQEHLKAGLPVREEMINYTKSGQPYWVDVNIFPLKNDSDVVTHYAAIERDITEIKDKAFNLEKLAKTDALTEVFNRRGLIEEGKRFVSTAMNNQTTFILAVMDIDFFKQVNDSYGHDVGDIVLKSLASVLTDNLRARDIVSRLGGEEFAILLQGEELPLLVQKIENLRQLIEIKETYISEQLSIKVTCSFGVAVCPEAEILSVSNGHKLDVEERLSHLMKIADVALYESKRNGRNKVTLSPIGSAPIGASSAESTS